MTGGGTGADALLVVSAIEISDVLWAVLAAVVVWGIGWGTILIFTKSDQEPAGGAAARPLERSPRRPGASSAPDANPGPAAATGSGASAPMNPAAMVPEIRTERSPVRDAEDIGGVLRWLLSETEAEAAAFLRLGPGGTERFLIEPRGLGGAAVSGLATEAREALVGAEMEEGSGTAIARWLGVGGSKVVLLRGVESKLAYEPMRFGRFAIEWIEASQGGDPRGVEEWISAIPGVAWAELTRKNLIRVMLAESVDPLMVRKAVEHAIAETGLTLQWIEPAARSLEPRAQLLDMTVQMDGQASAEVRLSWKGEELRGRAHSAPSSSGRQRAAAHATADALRPLLDTDVLVEGLYAHTHNGAQLVMVVVAIEGERLVGAVQAQPGDGSTGAARAVLDAVNRRLSRIAGQSGRI